MPEHNCVGKFLSLPPYLAFMGFGLVFCHPVLLKCPQENSRATEYLQQHQASVTPGQLPIDFADLAHPPMSFGVFEGENLLQFPMKVISDKGYLLIERS